MAEVKTATLDSCSRVNLIVDNMISGVECVNSERLQVQAVGVVPSMSIDKCSGVRRENKSKELFGIQVIQVQLRFMPREIHM